MNVSHHLTDETLQDYACGSLAASMETLVACHLTVCAHCRLRSEAADQVGGVLLASAEKSAMRTSAGDVLAIRAARKPAVDPQPDAPTLQPGIPRPLARLLPKPVSQLDWRRVAPGIKQYDLGSEPRGKGAFKLLHLAPGLVLSDHSHIDRELTYVVQGCYTDEIGTFSTGDIADLDGNHAHRPVVSADAPCIALIATQSPVRYSGFFGRVMQRFVGI